MKYKSSSRVCGYILPSHLTHIDLSSVLSTSTVQDPLSFFKSVYRVNVRTEELKIKEIN